MENEMILTIVLALLVVVSAVQAYQIIGLKGEITGATSQGTSPVNSQGSQPASSGTGGLPSNLQNAPDMVGGC